MSSYADFAQGEWSALLRFRHAMPRYGSHVPAGNCDQIHGMSDVRPHWDFAYTDVACYIDSKRRKLCVSHDLANLCSSAHSI